MRPWSAYICQRAKQKRNKNKANATAPFRFKSISKFIDAIEEYFQTCEPIRDEDGKVSPGPHPTISALCLHLTLTRQGFLNQAGRGVDWAEAVEWARLRVESYTEQHLFRGGYTPGIVMILKNRFGWSEQSEPERAIDALVDPDPDV